MAYSQTHAASKAKSAKKVDNTHHQLMKWATEEMKFYASLQNSQTSFELPSAQDLKFICTGPLVDVWKYVVSHVKHKETAKYIKGNVELKRNLGEFTSLDKATLGDVLDREEEKERQEVLHQQRNKLSHELEQTQAEVNQLRRELVHVADELAATELAYQSVCQSVRDLQRKETLLLVVQKDAGEKLARYAEYIDRVDKCIGNITDKKEDSQDNFMETKDGDLETNSCHMVRQVCEDVSQFLYHCLDGPADTAQLEKYKSDLLEKVDKAAAINSTWSLLAALATNAESDAQKLRQRTTEIDISKDAAEISFSYSPQKGLKDLSSPPSATETVKKLLLTSSEHHVLRWFKQQEHLNEEWKLNTQRDEILEELDKLLARLIGDHPSHLAAAKNYVSARIRLAEERAVAPWFRKEIARLRDRIDAAYRQKQELQQKHLQIQDFQKLVGKKQAVIGKLARLNANSPDRLQIHRQQVETYLESRSLLRHLTEVQTLPVKLKGALITELELFLGLLMPSLLTLALDSHTRISAIDLSIAPAMCAFAQERLQTYSDVGKAIEYPAFKSVESLPLHVLHIHSSLQKLKVAQRQQEVTGAAIKRDAGITDDIESFIETSKGKCSDLQKIAAQHDMAQVEDLLPRLKKAASLLQTGYTNCASFKKAVDIWWKQPAQWTTPWVQSGSLTFGQWMQRWRTAVSKVISRTGTRQ